MKLIILIGASVLVTGAPAVGQQTARGALRGLATARGSAIASQVVTVAGERGQDQPRAWRIVARDTTYPGRYLEFVMRDGRIIEEKALTAAQAATQRAAPLATRRVRIDSKQVFATADAEAKAALIGFDCLDYELRNKEFSQDPIWYVRLMSENGDAVGELVVAADTGTVLRRAWSDPPQSSSASAAAGRSHRGHVGSAQPDSAGWRGRALGAWERARDGFQTGREAIQSNFRKVTGNIRGVFHRSPNGRPEPKRWEEGVYDAEN
jgi:hypothetical protein